MCSANRDLLRSLYADWERGDWTALPTLADPEIEFVLADGLDPAGATGVDAMVRLYQGVSEHMGSAAHRGSGEYRELDDERILVYVHNRGRGRASRMEVGQLIGTGQGANPWFIRDGNLVKVAMRWDRARALADLGLAPEAGSV